MLQLGGGEDLMMSRLSSVTVRSPRMTTGMDLMHSPAALQIYMTFPAESTFTEDDVSNYFRLVTKRAARHCSVPFRSSVTLDHPRPFGWTS
jgi:hypothetical protein